MLISVGAQRHGYALRIAHVDPAFNHPSRGPFDGKYMQALYEYGSLRARPAPPSETRSRIFRCADRTSSSSDTGSAAPNRRRHRQQSTRLRYDNSPHSSGLPHARSGNDSNDRRVDVANVCEE
jgi:hypothetical protein